MELQKNYQNSKQLFELTIRVPKAEASFTYFILESNEGLCFYSTLDAEKGQLYRDITIFGPIENYSETKRLVKLLQEKYPLELLGDRTKLDREDN